LSTVVFIRAIRAIRGQTNFHSLDFQSNFHQWSWLIGHRIEYLRVGVGKPTDAEGAGSNGEVSAYRSPPAASGRPGASRRDFVLGRSRTC
jgi:hypothetical protein